MAARSHSVHVYANSKEEFSIADIVSRRLYKLPVVVTVGNTDYEIADQEDLPLDEEILLDKLQNVHFLRVKVLPFQDEAGLCREKGQEFVTERNRLVGEEYLLPAHYAGKVKFVGWPRRHHRFTSVEQVLEYLPRYVRVETPVQATGYGSTGGGTVDAKTVLELKQVGVHGDPGRRFLQCQTGDRQYKFSEDTLVNMTAVPDQKVYFLQDLRRVTNLLPTCIQIEPVPPDDVSLDNDGEASKLHHIIGGPLELISYQTNTLVFAWLKRKKDMSKVAIIPQCTWDKQTVSIQRSDTDISDVLREPSFKDVQDLVFIKTSLYMAPLGPSRRERLVWLRRTITPDYIDMNEQGEDAPGNNAPPPIPRRKPVANVKPFQPTDLDKDASSKPYPSQKVHTGTPSVQAKPRMALVIPEPQTTNQVEKVRLPTSTKIKDSDVLDKLKARAKMGFKKVHEELLSWKGGSKRSVKSPTHHTKSTSGVTSPTSHYKHTPPSPPASLEIPSKCTGPRTVKSPTSTYKPTPPCTPVPHKSRSARGQYNDSTKRPLPSVQKHDSVLVNGTMTGPVEEQTSYEDVEIGPEYDYAWKAPDAKKTDDDYLEPLTDLCKIGRGEQTAEDFYEYSVNEVYECFCMCSLNDFAENCRQQSLDGAFFRHFDINILRSEPFSLSPIALVKVRKTIDGWRPLRERQTKHSELI